MKLMIRVVAALCLSSAVFAQSHNAVVNQGSTPVVSGEPWKGAPYEHAFEIHGGVGLGIFEGEIGPSFLFGLAFELSREGFVGDGINDQVYLELTTGPLVLANLEDPWLYSVHLRWDFHKDIDWTIYAVGGLGGSLGTNSARFFPRFGMGVMKHFTDDLALRMEVSHEWITVGANFGF